MPFQFKKCKYLLESFGFEHSWFWNTNKTTWRVRMFISVSFSLQQRHSSRQFKLLFPKKAKQMSRNEAIRQIYFPRFYALLFWSGPLCLYLICIDQYRGRLYLCMSTLGDWRESGSLTDTNAELPTCLGN